MYCTVAILVDHSSDCSREANCVHGSEIEGGAVPCAGSISHECIRTLDTGGVRSKSSSCVEVFYPAITGSDCHNMYGFIQAFATVDA